MKAEELRKAIGRVIAGRPRLPSSPQMTPGCAFGAVVESRIGELEREFSEIRGRLNGLFFLVLGAVVVEVVLRLVR